MKNGVNCGKPKAKAKAIRSQGRLRRQDSETTRPAPHSVSQVKVWERGAGATLACGTGACASLVAAAVDKGIHRDVDVELPGGKLHVSWSESGDVYITGPAEKVFEGDLGSVVP